MASKLSLRKVVLAVALLPFVGLPLVSVVAWHCGDTLVPNDDAGQYAQTAAEIYRPLSDGRPFRYVRNLYLKRGIRPVSLSSFAALCLPFADTDLKFATGVTICFFYALLYGYTFLVLRLSTTAPAAVFGAALLTTLPWILQYSTVFYADVPMIAAMVAVLYHARRSANWTSLPHSIALGLALALAISLRPIEPLPAVATMLALLLANGFAARQIGLRDLRPILTLVVPLVVLLLLCVFEILRSKLLAAGLFCPAIALYARQVRRSPVPLNRCFAATVGTLLGGIGLWYLPAAAETWNWVWSCSMGDLNRLYKGVGKLDFATALSMIGTNLGGIQLAIVAGLAAWALAAAAGAGRFTWVFATAAKSPGSTEPATGLRRIQTSPGALILIAGAVQIALVIAAALVTPGTDMRRGFVGFYWTFLGLVMYATSPALRWHRLRTVGLGGLAAVQLLTVSYSVLGVVPAALGPLTLVTRAVYPAQQTWPDKTRRTFDALLAHIPAKSYVAAMTVSINAFPQRVFDQSALTALSSVRKSSVRFGCPCVFDTLADGYRQLAQYPLVLVDTRPTMDSIPPQKRAEPYSMLSEDLAVRYRDHRLAEVGLQPYARFKIDDVELVVLEWMPQSAVARGASSQGR